MTPTTATTDWTPQSAQKWVKGGTWKKGLKLDVYPDVDAVEFAKQYHANQAIWDKAFAYMRDNDLAALPNGSSKLDGDLLTLSVTEPTSKEFDKTQWESHRKYIDLQYIVRGKEKMGVQPLSNLTVTEPYNEAKDVAHYSGDGGKYYDADPSTIYLFFPQDGHRPSIKVEGYDVVKKVVFKIRVAGM
ncbi:YhcH/YjgK/YiaL family protein [Hymenobacter sp. BT491]|uniref:YhcH/YjgK/YiaL family protein n=1 Tax=Hymenobacter sp. BT491 TaxID=2766779 RepID=UPI00165370EA|nr:YhcH/YjgK/YiaL family protein [Hymenobacter sp. BT491]MBC6991917.1 YhcH/YjgK/YiaL family protein [Hymenobacter sp. BT491]